jgi:hypothetical protein
LLAIPQQNRLTIKASRLPVRVIKIVKGAYTLLSSQGQIRSSYLASLLVPVLSGEDFGVPEAPGERLSLLLSLLLSPRLIIKSLFLLCRKREIRLLRKGSVVVQESKSLQEKGRGRSLLLSLGARKGKRIKMKKRTTFLTVLRHRQRD